MLWLPSVKGVFGVKLQVPSLATVVLPSTVSPSLMVMTLPAMPVPAIVGVLSLVEPPDVIGPITGA